MLRGMLLLLQPSVHMLCCTSERKGPWRISCHGLSIFPRLGLGKVHGPGTYIITRIAMTQTQKQKYARRQQPDILFLDFLLNLSYDCTLTDTTDPVPYTPKSTTLSHSQMNKFFYKKSMDFSSTDGLLIATSVGKLSYSALQPTGAGRVRSWEVLWRPIACSNLNTWDSKRPPGKKSTGKEKERYTWVNKDR